MTEPTDAEIKKAAEDYLLRMFGSRDLFNEVMVEFARTVLAKWGQPAVAGEPVAWEATVPGYIKYVTQSAYEKFSNTARRGYKPYKCSSCAGQQPTQAQALDEMVALSEQAGLYEHDFPAKQAGAGTGAVRARLGEKEGM